MSNKRVTYEYDFEAGAGASGEETIKVMGEGQSFTLKKATVYGEGSFDNRVEIQVLYGTERILPEENDLPAFTEPMSGTTDRTYGSGSTISVHYNNQDGAAAHNVVVILEGEEFTDEEV